MATGFVMLCLIHVKKHLISTHDEIELIYEIFTDFIMF